MQVVCIKEKGLKIEKKDDVLSKEKDIDDFWLVLTMTLKVKREHLEKRRGK